MSSKCPLLFFVYRSMIRSYMAESASRDDIKSAKEVAQIFMGNPKAMQSKTGTSFSLNRLNDILANGSLSDINRMNNALAKNLRDNGENPYRVIKTANNAKIEQANAKKANVRANVDSYLGSLGNDKFMQQSRRNTLNGRCNYKGKTMTKAERVEEMIANGEYFRQHGDEFIGVTSNGTFKATKGEYRYYEYLKRREEAQNHPNLPAQWQEPSVEGEVQDVQEAEKNEQPYNANQLEAPAINAEHLSSEKFLKTLNSTERGFMQYLDDVFDDIKLGFNDVMQYLNDKRDKIFDKRMEYVISKGIEGLSGAFYTDGGKMVLNEVPSQEVQSAWTTLLGMRKNFGASLANAPEEYKNEYLRVEKIVKDYLRPTITEQCKKNESYRRLSYAITGLEKIADKANEYERRVSEEGRRSGPKSYRDVSAEEGQAIEGSAVAWANVLQNGIKTSKPKRNKPVDKSRRLNPPSGITEDNSRAYGNKPVQQEESSADTVEENTPAYGSDRNYHTESGKPINEAEEREFIVKPNGDKNFGEISQEIETKTNGVVKAAPIRLQVGNEHFGYIHLLKHAEQIKQKGYDIMGYINHILNNFTQIYSQQTANKPNRFVLYCNDKSKGFMPIDLEFEQNSKGYYTIVSLMPHRAKIKGTLLFDGSANPSTATADGTLLDESSKNGGAATSPNTHEKSNVPSTTSTIPQNQQNVKEKKSIIERKTQAKQQDSNSMHKELIEQAAANEDAWVNSEKSELHLEDDNDTVVKLTPQELKYYHDLIKKDVVGKPELYKKAPEDVGEMDNNVEVSKEQKQIYDENNGDRDMPNSDSESIEQEESAKENPKTVTVNGETFYFEKPSGAGLPLAMYGNKKSHFGKGAEKKKTIYHANRQQYGNEVEVRTDDGKPIKAHYALIPADKLIASNKADDTLSKNEAYPQDLQPRDRQRTAMRLQVDSMANSLRPEDLADSRNLNQGAPIVRSDLTVLNGNGRTLAIQRAYQTGKAEEYKQYLLNNAEKLGLSKSQVAEMVNGRNVLNTKKGKYERTKSSQPILVRVVDELSEGDTQSVINSTTGGQRMGSTEQAKADSKKIKSDTLRKYTENNKGDLTTAANEEFLGDVLKDIVPVNERNAYLTKDGKINKDGLARAERALFSRAYGDESLLEDFGENLNEEARNMTNALRNNAPAIARLQQKIKEGNAHDIGLQKNLVEAVKAIKSAIKQNKPAQSIWEEQTMFDDTAYSPETIEIAKVLHDLRRSGRKLSAFMGKLADLNEQHGNPKDEDLFTGEELAEPSLMNDIPIANQYAEELTRAKYSRDAENQLDNQGEKADNEEKAETPEEIENGIFQIPPKAQAAFEEHLSDDDREFAKDIIAKQIGENIKDFNSLVDPVEFDAAFTKLPFVKKIRIEFNMNRTQRDESQRNRCAVSYEYARRCFLNDPRVKAVIIHAIHDNTKQSGVEISLRQGTSGRTGRKGNSVQSINSGTFATPGLGEFSKIHKQFTDLVGDKQSRDVSAFSFAGNPLSEEALKAKAEFETPLDKLEKVSRERLRKVERNIQDFGKRIGVPVHFVYHPDRGYRGVCIHNGGIYINLNSNVPARRIFMHEFVHWLKASGKDISC